MTDFCLLFLSEDTVVTDHVRSIVKECLQEADVHWTNPQDIDTNNNDYYDKFIEESDENFSDRQNNFIYTKVNIECFVLSGSVHRCKLLDACPSLMSRTKSLLSLSICLLFPSIRC